MHGFVPWDQRTNRAWTVSVAWNVARRTFRVTNANQPSPSAPHTPDTPDKQPWRSVDVGAWKSRDGLLPLDSQLFGSPQEQNVPTPPNMIFSCGYHDRTSSCEWPYKSPRDKWIRFCHQTVPRWICGREDREYDISQYEVDLAFMNAMNDDQEKCRLNVQSGGVKIRCGRVGHWALSPPFPLSSFPSSLCSLCSRTTCYCPLNTARVRKVSVYALSFSPPHVATHCLA
jgi:hypothetical protein